MLLILSSVQLSHFGRGSKGYKPFVKSARHLSQYCPTISMHLNCMKSVTMVT